MLLRELAQQWAMLKYHHAEPLQVHGRQGRVEGADEILVEPLRLLDLEAYSFDRLEFFLWKIDDEANTEVI